MAGGDVALVGAIPGGVVYLADQELDEQVELFRAALCLFADGFESGDTTAWSASSP